MTRIQAARSLRLTLCLLCLLLPQQSRAGERIIQGNWHIQYLTIPFAKLWVAVDQSGARYDVTASFKSQGIVKIFKKMKSLTTARIINGPNGFYSESFEYEHAEEGKRTSLAYDAGGALVAREVTPEDDPTHRPPVPTAEVRGSHTPAGILFAMQHTLRSLPKQQGETFDFNLYEGKRLMKIHATYLGKTALKKDGSLQAHQIAVTRTLSAGFTEKEKARYATGEPPVFVFLSDDEEYFPIALRVQMPIGMLQAYWESEK